MNEEENAFSWDARLKATSTRMRMHLAEISRRRGFQPRSYGCVHSIYSNQLSEIANQGVLGGGRSRNCGSSPEAISKDGVVSGIHSVAGNKVRVSIAGANKAFSAFPSTRVRFPHGHSGALPSSELPSRSFAFWQQECVAPLESFPSALPEQQQMGTANHAIRMIAMSWWTVCIRFTDKVCAKNRRKGRRICHHGLAAGASIRLKCRVWFSALVSEERADLFEH